MDCKQKGQENIPNSIIQLIQYFHNKEASPFAYIVYFHRRMCLQRFANATVL